MENRDYKLDNIRRFFNFHLPISQLSLRPKNCYAHVNSRPQSVFMTFVLDQEQKEMIWTENSKPQCFSHTPRMIITYPGVLKHTINNSVRSEIMFVYDQKYAETFRNLGLKTCNFTFTDSFNACLKKIRSAVAELNRPGIADKLDAWAWELALEASLSSIDCSPEKNMPDSRIFEIANYFRFHFRQKIDLVQLLNRNGLSPRTFYREWNKFFTESPARYLQTLRLNHSIELLSNPSLRIYEISDSCGFCDPMYFQRCFSKRFKMPPGKYRETILKVKSQ